MKNWAGNLKFSPKNVIGPSSSEEIIELVNRARRDKRKIRLRGSGHSWTGLIATNDLFVHLDYYQGIIDVKHELGIIKAKAGTKLYAFGELGFEHQLAMENQGDINRQSLAGATSTGTHGTGVTLQSVANQITGLSLINGRGERVDLDATHPSFNAARISIGALGIIDTITMKLVPSYKLKVTTFAEDFSAALEAFPQRLRENRHLEMFYFPVGGWSLTKIMNQTHEEVTPQSIGKKINEIMLENWLYTQLNRLASTTGRYRLIDKVMRTFVSPEMKVDWSHRAFPTMRSFKFMEMEYNLPIEKFETVMEELRSEISRQNFQTLFPIEIRFVKGDGIWLSPACGRDSVYFAVHTYISENWRPYFSAMEKIFRRHGGRPHWGKWHSMTCQEFQEVYPHFDDFKKVREEFDPDQIFINPHLKEIFGL